MKRRQLLQTTLQATGAALLAQSLHPSRSIATTVRWPSLPEGESPRKLALLIGINDYLTGCQSKPSDVHSLQGCHNDVDLMKTLLIHRYGFEPNDISTLIDKEATRTAILDKIKNHLLQANPEDTVVFYFSGHGSRLKNPQSPTATTTGIVPYDHSKTPEGNTKIITNYITGTTLFLLRSAFKTDRVTFIFDCCYSGGSIRGDYRIRTDSPAIGQSYYPNEEEQDYQQRWIKQLKINRNSFSQSLQEQKGPKGIVISATNELQQAGDTVFNKIHNAGAFTKLFTEALWNDANQSFNTIEVIVRSELTQFYQTPIFTYPETQQDKLKNQPIFFTPARFPKLSFQGIVIATEPETRKVTLWLGGLTAQTLNLAPGSEFRLITTHRQTPKAIVRLDQKLEPDFTAIATVPEGQPMPVPGTLVQQDQRIIPDDFQLRIGFDDSLEQKAQIPDEWSSRIQGVPRQADGSFGGVDLILSKMTPAYQRLNRTASVGGYGLFSSQLKLIPNSLESPDETIDNAIKRLGPFLSGTLIRKLIGAMALTPAELNRTNIPNVKVHLKDQPDAIVAIPNQSKRSVKIGQTIMVEPIDSSTVNSKARRNTLLIFIAPSGTILPQYRENWSTPGELEIEEKYGTGETGEILVIQSPNSLAILEKQIQLLVKEGKPVFNLDKTTRSEQGDLLVLSFPIHIHPKN